ncbi:hypothetical protein [Flavobacterium anhuiense]|uniref:hypothetical protein n=1 Tax=Flavobacterium anhuiense TaxID=459526 RepID=UPI003D951A58
MSKNVIHNFDIVIKNSASTKSSEDLKEIFLKELAKVSKEMSKEKDVVQLWQEYKNNSVSTSSNISTERIENNTLEGIKNPIISTLKKAKQDSKISETVSEFKFFNILDNSNKVIDSLRANNISSQTLKEEKGLENLHNNLTSQIYATNVSTEQSLLIPSKITMTGNETYSDVIKTKIKKKLNAELIEKEIDLTNYEATISKDIFNKTDQEYFVQQSSIDKEDKIENLYKASESSINNMSWKKVSDLMIFKLLELSKEEKNIYLKENYDILIKKIARPNLNIQQLFSEHEELFLLLKTLFPGLPGKITFQTQKTVYPDLGSQKMYPEIGVEKMYFKASEVLLADLASNEIKDKENKSQTSTLEEGDYFDINGNYLGSNKDSEKRIYIVGRDSLQKSYTNTNLPEGFYDKYVSFNGIGNIVNSKVGHKNSQQINKLRKEEIMNVACNILNHYYREAGYDINELKFKAITEVPDKIPGGAFALTRLGGVSSHSEELQEGEKDISVTYPHLGIHILTGYDIINLFSHERGQHLEDLMKYKKKLWTVFPGPYEVERRAYMHQLKHETWIKTSPEFKGYIWSVISSYVHPIEYGPYLKDNYKIVD